MSRDQLQTQDFFLSEQKENARTELKTQRHVTTLSNQVPETISFTDASLHLFQEEVSLGSYF